MKVWLNGCGKIDAKCSGMRVICFLASNWRLLGGYSGNLEHYGKKNNNLTIPIIPIITNKVNKVNCDRANLQKNARNTG